MARMPRTLERVDRRVLGAVRLLDAATGRPIARPLTVAADGVRFLRQREGFYVITEAPGLGEHRRSFEEPPPDPPVGSAPIERLRIEDPLGQYLPRLARIPLPRAPHPAAGEPDLFEPEPIAMLLAPTASPRLDWGGWRASVRQAGASVAAVRGALLVLVWATPGGTPVRARGMSDERGEALVPVPGLPVSRAADGPGDPPLTATTTATLSVFLTPDQPWPVDPDGLEAGAAPLPPERVAIAPSTALRLRAGVLAAAEVRLTI
jgi:hypothetical protein